MSDEGHRLAEAALAAGSKSFTLAARLLPRRARADAAVCYAFCRRADDLIDLGESSPAGALLRLRAEVDAIYTGTPQSDPVLAAFAELVRRRQIPRAYPEALLDGFAMDADGALYDAIAKLDLYCFRVAGVVGLMMCHVLGVADVEALPRAAHLGMAMQLTNIGRDVAEDWRRGRLYLPAPLFTASVYPGGDPPPALRGELATATRALIARAETLYRSGRRGLVALPWRVALAIRVAASVYAEIGAVLGRRHFDAFGARAVVSLRRKLWLVVRAAASTLAEAPRRLARLGRHTVVPSMARPLRFPDDIHLPA